MRTLFESSDSLIKVNIKIKPNLICRILNTNNAHKDNWCGVKSEILPWPKWMMKRQVDIPFLDSYNNSSPEHKLISCSKEGSVHTLLLSISVKILFITRKTKQKLLFFEKQHQMAKREFNPSLTSATWDPTLCCSAHFSVFDYPVKQSSLGLTGVLCRR